MEFLHPLSQVSRRYLAVTAVIAFIAVIVATVLPEIAQAQGADFIIDNTDSQARVISGNWWVATGGSNYQGSNYFATSNSRGGEFRWTPDLAGRQGQYDVYVKFARSWSHLGTDAPYTVASDSGSDTVLVDQTQNGGSWVLLGRYAMRQGSYVSLGDTLSDNGRPSADAIRLIQADGATNRPPPDEIVIDNTDPQAQPVAGNWWNVTAGSGYQGQNFTTTVSNGVGKFRWTPPLAGIAGDYDVYVRYATGWSHLGIDAPYTVVHDAGTDTVVVDQTRNGGQWVLLGRYPMSVGSYISLTASMSDGARPSVDAVRLVSAVQATPQPVQATADTAITDAVTPVEIDVLANDTGGIGPVSVSDVTQGSNGNVSTDGTTVTYTPNAGFTGTESFSYTATDGTTSDTAEVTVNVALQQPADLEIVQSLQGSTAVGATTSIELSVTNLGPASVDGIEAVHLLGDGLSYLSHVGDGYDSLDGSWDIGTLPSGETATVVVDALVGDNGSYTTSAEITAASRPDPDASNNNTATETLTPVAGLNVLLIMIDDLRPEVGAYGVSEINTPNIDALARQGTMFTRAYAQMANCSPSRTSMLTGLRPDTTAVQDLTTHFRDTVPNVVTLPQYFKNRGYVTEGFCKVYHDGLDDAESWSVPHEDAFGPGAPKGSDGKRLAYASINKPASAFADYQCANLAIDAIDSTASSHKPFFIAVGFKKPHLPFLAPKAYYDMYDPYAIPQARHPAKAAGAPSAAFENRSELHTYSGIPNASQPLGEQLERNLKRGYYAATTFVDAQVGRVLAALDSAGAGGNTIVVVLGDHGFHLGEEHDWGKHTDFEVGTRVPLIIRVPGKAGNHSTAALAELVDLYPTIVQLAGLPMPTLNQRGGYPMEGDSLVGFINSPSTASRRGAFSEWNRYGYTGSSIRTNQYRYTEWSNNTKTLLELYDHDADPDETVNVSGRSQYQGVIQALHEALSAGGQADLPPELR